MNVKMTIIVASFILADILTGLIAAVRNGEYKSSVMRVGLWSKLGEVAAILLSVLCEWALPVMNVDIQLPIFEGVSGYICIMELGSCVENITKISPELKTVLGRYLGIYKNKE
jgi:phage-related holin